MSFPTLFFALAGGILPPLVWLWFWRHEDRAAPEPRPMIFFGFIAGMLMVPIVLPFERAAADAFGGGLVTLILWASIEEIGKFIAAFATTLNTRFADEPIDMVIYLITAALGFAALENALFILGPADNGDFFLATVTGNMRFVGATLLHTLASAVIGAALAASFYRHRRIKIGFVVLGISSAIALHTAFNFFIMKSTGNDVFVVFGAVWLSIIILIFILERIKRKRRCKI